MKRLLLFAIGITLAAFIGAQETTTTAPPPATSTGDPLVKAARDTKARRKKTTGKVITNADVKKSKGKIVVRQAAGTDPAVAEDKSAGLQQRHDINQKERAAASERVETARKKVGELQKGLDDLEQRYYEENDPNYRDDVIQKRFAQTKKQLDAARQELADARDSLDRLEKPPQK